MSKSKVQTRIEELAAAGKRVAFIREMILDEGLVSNINEAKAATDKAGLTSGGKRGHVDEILEYLAQAERSAEELEAFLDAYPKTHQKIRTTYYDKFREVLNTVRKS